VNYAMQRQMTRLAPAALKGSYHIPERASIEMVAMEIESFAAALEKFLN